MPLEEIIEDQLVEVDSNWSSLSSLSSHVNQGFLDTHDSVSMDLWDSDMLMKIEEGSCSKQVVSEVSLTDHEKLIASIDWLKDHVPVCVLNQLGQENKKLGLSSNELPHKSNHESALLFVDVAGFTHLSLIVDPEQLSKIINSYFQLIVNEIVCTGGDVIKFAGDALFAEWEVVAPIQNETGFSRSLPECVAIAATCGARIVASLSDFSVYGSISSGNGYSSGSALAVLNIHCGLGAGTIIGIHVGDNECRREYLILGDAIDQIAEASEHASLGQLVASREALDLLNQTCRLDPSVTESPDARCALIAHDNTSLFDPLPTSTWMEKGENIIEYSKWKEMNIKKLKEYQKLLSLYVHPVVVDNDRLITDSHRARKVQQRHSEEAQIRSVYTMFIGIPEISVVGDDSIDDQKKIETLNNIMNLTTRTLDRFNGHLRQFIFDDKGLVLIATFGLRGSTCPNMIADRALPATCVIYDALRLELGIQSRIGATLGNAYCGVIGGITRHEYAVLGASVNLAARLMSSKGNPGILVDDAVRQNADKAAAFTALPPVQAKSYADPVPIYEPLRNREQDWGIPQTVFVGREREISEIISIVQDMVSNRLPPKVTLVEASTGLGKTALIVHAVESIISTLRKENKRVTVLRHVCKESQKNVPLNIFRSILVDLLDVPDDAYSGVEEVSENSFSNNLEGNFGASIGNSSSKRTISVSMNQLLAICEQVRAPPEFTQWIARHLLDVDLEPVSREVPKNAKLPALDLTLRLLAQLFELCTSKSAFVLLALDDVHYLDEFSARVVESFLRTKGTMLIICTSRPLPRIRTQVGFDLWENLERAYEKENRFISIKLKRLNEYDIRSMIAKKLDLKEEQISDAFVEGVFENSAGEPPFANEILENAKRKNFVKFLPASRTYGFDDDQSPFATVKELMVTRIDAFDSEVRNLLDIAAVMGDSFEMSDVGAVVHRKSGDAYTSENWLLHILRVQRLLDQLVEEGILIENIGDNRLLKTVYKKAESGEVNGKVENREFFFTHSVWRSVVLKMMLRIRQAVIHRYIALVLEGKQQVSASDYIQKMKLFQHWKASSDTSKAATLALSIGESLEDLGMSEDGSRVFEEALSMWEEDDVEGAVEAVKGFTLEALESIDALDLDFIIRLKCGIGRCAAKMDDATLCVTAYCSALRILQICPSADDLADRSVVFPVFSGLFLCIRMGTIEQDSDLSYEQLLVRSFMHETRVRGDEIHYIRALAMQGELCAKMGRYDQAFEAHRELEQVYDPGRHSRKLCKIYVTDCAAASFSRSAIWHLQECYGMRAIETCQIVLSDIIPKMEPSNVYNTTRLIYPILWVMQDLGKAAEARVAFEEHVVEKFKLYHGEGITTVSNWPLYASILMVLDLASHRSEEKIEREDEYKAWAMNIKNLQFGSISNISMAHFGRAPDSISAEICLFLAERSMDKVERAALLQNGIDVITELAMCIMNTADLKSSYAYSKVESVLEDLAAACSKELKKE